MISGSSISGRTAAVAATTPLSVRIDPLLLKRAEGVAAARGTTLSRLLSEYVQALADSDYVRLAWLDQPLAAYWDHLETKHR